jgi:uncharacterized protein (DUF2235 family)
LIATRKCKYRARLAASFVERSVEIVLERNPNLLDFFTNEAKEGIVANIIIYSDGTGQRGGLTFDERRSNIYKLFRATRCGPDSSVDPAEQLTFYDPGLGTLPPGHDFGVVWAVFRWFRNLVSQATGLGITANIIDCYAAIIRLWRPGDRIFLFGFSRGAYTVRCLSGVLGMCGVPTQGKDGEPLRRDENTAKRLAAEAVKKVYQHTETKSEVSATERERELLTQRSELARRFRTNYASADPVDAQKSNGDPYFIGVFDTVASLADPVVVIGLCTLAIGALVIFSVILAFFTSRFWFWFELFGLLLFATIGIAVIVNTIKRIHSELNLPRNKKWRVFHFTEWRMKFYDTALSTNVSLARHAISIDECRASFQRVAWGSRISEKRTQPEWLEQIWFAGNHSDIGGSYSENESRLSDISLKWMLDAAVSVGMKYDSSVLRLYPDPAGPQHDETRSSFFRYFKKLPRTIEHDSPLHPSVLERFKAAIVLDYDMMTPYRPENLSTHDAVKEYYK